MPTIPTPDEVFDTFGSSDFLLSPAGFLARLRREAPLIYLPALGTWMVFRYADVQRVFTDHTTYSSKVTFPPEQKDFTQSVNFMDPPRHRLVRSLAQQSFTPGRVEAMAPRIEQIAHDLLDTALARGELDFILDYANPLPVIVIAEILGVPAGDTRYFTELSNRVVTMDQAAISELAAYFRTLIDHRKAHPGDDLITSLVQAHGSGESLSEQELVDFCIVLLVAGNETTAKLIGNTMLCLRDFPEMRGVLLGNPELAGAFVEEVLRLRPPVQTLPRTVRTDTILYGQTLQAGDQIEPFIGAANRDEAVFDDPGTLQLGRKGRHLSFGNGIHFCLGAPLARLETRIALMHALQRLPNIETLPGADLMPIPTHVFHGLVSLPVRY